MHTGHLTRAVVITFMIAAAGHKACGPDIMHFFEGVSMPSFAPSFQGWLLYKGAFYVLCMYLLYEVARLSDPKFPLPFWLVLTTMLGFEWWNYLVFAKENFQAAFYFKLGYAFLCGGTTFSLFRLNKKLGAWFGIYLVVVLVFELWWSKGLGN